MSYISTTTDLHHHANKQSVFIVNVAFFADIFD